MIAARGIAGARLLVALSRGSGRGRVLAAWPPGRSRTHIQLTESVLVSLLGACVVWPSFVDDGWIMAKQSTFSSSGGFSLLLRAVGSKRLARLLARLAAALAWSGDERPSLSSPACVALSRRNLGLSVDGFSRASRPRRSSET